MKDANRRKRNVIISGLPEVDSRNDFDLFAKFCADKLDIRPHIVFPGTPRLGKTVNSSGRPRRLLVHLSSDLEINEVFTLRQSEDRVVADNVSSTRIYRHLKPKRLSSGDNSVVLLHQRSNKNGPAKARIQSLERMGAGKQRMGAG
jgi:hypothetical protein